MLRLLSQICVSLKKWNVNNGEQADPSQPLPHHDAQEVGSVDC